MDQKEKQALKNLLGTPLTREDHVRRNREALLLKEQLSSIPWHAKRGKEEGMSYWLRLLDSCAARGLPETETSNELPRYLSEDLDDIPTEELFNTPTIPLNRKYSSEEILQEEPYQPPSDPNEALCLLKARPLEPSGFKRLKLNWLF